jgi:hypothetical protein
MDLTQEQETVLQTVDRACEIHGLPTYGELQSRAAAAEARAEKMREALIDATAHLAAATSLLERGGKKAAASDKMFAIMLGDYNAALKRSRDTLAAPTP